MQQPLVFMLRRAILYIQHQEEGEGGLLFVFFVLSFYYKI